MNIVAYCRVSTDTTDQLNSLEAQKSFFMEYCQKNGGNLVKIYADEGISGTKIKNRKEFLRLMNDAKHGLFDMVVVKDISRFARNTVDFLQSIRALKSLGIETVFLTSNQTVLGNSEFVLTIFGALAQEESANTSKRVKFGKKMNAEKGRVPNIVYGYDKIKGEYFDLVINDYEANVVRRIYDTYLNSGYGALKIAQLLNNEGIKTKRGCKWSQNAISRILSNELYTGKIINGKEEVEDFLTGIRTKKDKLDWVVVQRPEIKIITSEDYDKAQLILSSRLKAFNLNGERQSNKYLFSTLIKCKHCNYSFRRVEHTYKNTYVRWVCSGRASNGKDSCCNKTILDDGELIVILKEYFENVLKNKTSMINDIIKEFTRVYRTKDDNVSSEKELQDRYNKLQKNRQKYMEMYTDDLIGREELKEKMDGLNTDIAKVESELKRIRCNLNKGDLLEKVLVSTFKTIEDIVAFSNMDNVQLKKIIRKIEVAEDGNVDVVLNLFSDIGLEKTFYIANNRT